MKVEEFTSVVTGGTPSTKKDEYWNNGNIPWLQSGCCQNCDVYATDTYITQSGYDNSSAKMMPKNTVMIALTGATAGKVGYLNFEACGNQSITGILPSELVLPRFLFYYLLLQREKILNECVGAAQPHISQGYVKKFLVPIAEKEVQQEFVSFAEQSDKSKLLCGELAKCELLKDDISDKVWSEFIEYMNKKACKSAGGINNVYRS